MYKSSLPPLSIISWNEDIHHFPRLVTKSIFDEQTNFKLLGLFFLGACSSSARFTTYKSFKIRKTTPEPELVPDNQDKEKSPRNEMIIVR